MSGRLDTRLEMIIEQALELDAAERGAFLDSVCADDASMRAELEGLLRSAIDDDGQVLKELFGEVRNEVRRRVEIPSGTRLLDRFTVLKKIGSGGMADVYLVREDDFDRNLALKVIREDLDGSEFNRNRFLNEARLLGLLQNQNIVPVHRMGELDDHRPYYAMRFVRGASLMEAINLFYDPVSAPHDPRDRVLRLHSLLRRFVDVCNAAAYAHNRGVVHRDIKPANIILGDDGEYGETFLVDWGLAKLVSPAARGPDDNDALISSATSNIAATHPGLVSGTPEYMSPEQAAGDPAKVGPPSDIYSLGATLYTLLTGRVPFEDESVTGILRKVRTGQFVPPAAVRDGVPRPLDAICLKAMALAPERRYPSAQALSKDIEAWMADEPVSAWREPMALRTRRWMRRHRTLMVSTAAVLMFAVAGLSGFAIVLSGKNRQLDRQRAAAVEQRNRALAAEATAKAEEEKAKRSESESRAVLDFFENKVIAAARPKDWEGGIGADATIRAALTAAEPSIQDSFADNPQAEASIRNALGQSYLYLGEPAQAIRQFRRAYASRREFLGPDHTDTLDAMNNLGYAYRDTGQLKDALPLLQDALERCDASLGPNHTLTLNVMNNLAGGYRESRRPDDALRLNQETLRRRTDTVGPDHPDTLASLSYLGKTLWWAERYDEAVRIHEQALQRRQAKLGPTHADTLLSMHDLATAYYRVGRVDTARALLEQTLTQRRAVLGPDPPGTLITMDNLATVYAASGRPKDALLLHEEAFQGLKARLNLEHRDTLIAMNNLIAGYLDAARWHEAENAARECLATRARVGPDDWWRFHTMSQLGAALLGQKRYAQAESLVLDGYTGLKRRATKIPRARKKSLTDSADRILALYDCWGKRDKVEEWRSTLANEIADLNFPTDPFAR
jgi:eukaryotic-like serine/threonine-protein kinase